MRDANVAVGKDPHMSSLVRRSLTCPGCVVRFDAMRTTVFLANPTQTATQCSHQWHPSGRRRTSAQEVLVEWKKACVRVSGVHVYTITCVSAATYQGIQ